MMQSNEEAVVMIDLVKEEYEMEDDVKWKVDFLDSLELFAEGESSLCTSEVYKCDNCDKQFTNALCLDSHIQTHSQNFSNPQRPELFPETCHMKSQYPANPDPVATAAQAGNACDAEGMDHSTGLTATHTKCPEESLACPKCDTNFKNKAAIKSHMNFCRKKTPVRPFPCPYCKMNYRGVFCLKRHINACHPGLPWEIKGFPVSCTICELKFESMEGLKSHEQAHKIRQLLTCGVCGKSCAEERYMKIHLRIHEKTYTDDRISGKSDDPGVAQKECPRKRAQRKVLTCPICGKSFVRLPYIINHINSHTNSRIWECPTCFHKFQLTQDLMTHMTNTCDGVFWCQFCDFFCEAPLEYVRHVRNHEEFKLIFCPFCSQGFRKMDEFTDHIDKIHKEEED